MTRDTSTSDNRLLALMSDEDVALLSPYLEACDLPKGMVLVAADSAIEQVYFLRRGVASVVAISPEGQEVEAGLFGRDGAGPVPALLGIERSTHRVLIQVAGEGHRIARDRFAEAREKSSAFADLFARFAQVMRGEIEPIQGRSSAPPVVS